jgi:hypothetical protein
LSLTQLFLGVDRRSLFGYGLGILVSAVTLAGVYVFAGGPSLAQMENYAAFDSLLYTFATVSGIAGVSGSFYYFTRNLSVSLSPLVGVAVGRFSGLQDVMVYVFCTVRQNGRCGNVTGLPNTLPWLEDSYIGILLRELGFETVTSLSLVVSSALFLGFGIVFLKILETFDPVIKSFAGKVFSRIK